MNEQDYSPELWESMDSLSKLLTSDETVESTVGRIAQLSVLAIDGAEECSISMGEDETLKTLAVTAEVCVTIDELQRQTNEGPCLSSARHGATFYIPDMANDETWPNFSQRAAEATGIASLLAYVLEVGGESTAALNVMSYGPDAFDEDAMSAGAVFAAHAAVALANALTHDKSQKKVGQLEEGLRTRQLIGEAVGIVMATRKVDSQNAFEILKRISQHTNVKLKEIAAGLVERVDEL